MANNRRYSGATPQISKDWKPSDGIKALPASIRSRVIKGLDYMLVRIRERNANMLPLTWNRDRLVETVDALENAGYMAMSWAEGDPDPKNKAAFLANANH